MKHTISLIAAAATLAAAGAAHALTAAQTVDIIARNGYYAPHGLELTSGVWHAKVTAPSGKRVYALVDNASGAFSVIDPAALRNGHGLPSAAQVVQTLQDAGWSIVQELEFDDGLWEAEVRRAKGQPKYEVYVHPVTLAILNDGGTPASSGTSMSALSAQQIIAALQSAGYRNIHDVEFDDDGYWEADATNADGQCVELDINPTTGAVMREKVERGSCTTASGNTGSTTRTTIGATSTATKPATGTTTTASSGSRLTATQVMQRLQLAGYTNIHDLEYDRDDGYWEADARNARGQKVELHIDPSTGKVIKEKRD